MVLMQRYFTWTTVARQLQSGHLAAQSVPVQQSAQQV